MAYPVALFREFVEDSATISPVVSVVDIRPARSCRDGHIGRSTSLAVDDQLISAL